MAAALVWCESGNRTFSHPTHTYNILFICLLGGFGWIAPTSRFALNSCSEVEIAPDPPPININYESRLIAVSGAGLSRKSDLPHNACYCLLSLIKLSLEQLLRGTAQFLCWPGDVSPSACHILLKIVGKQALMIISLLCCKTHNYPLTREGQTRCVHRVRGTDGDWILPAGPAALGTSLLATTHHQYYLR